MCGAALHYFYPVLCLAVLLPCVSALNWDDALSVQCTIVMREARMTTVIVMIDYICYRYNEACLLSAILLTPMCALSA